MHTAPAGAAVMWAPHLVSQAAAATTLVLMSVRRAIAQSLPSRAEWSVHGAREAWRDVGHRLANAVLAIHVSHLFWLGGLARALASLSLAILFGLWPTASPVWLHIGLVRVLGDALAYSDHRLGHTSPILGSCTRCITPHVRLPPLQGFEGEVFA